MRDCSRDSLQVPCLSQSQVGSLRTDARQRSAAEKFAVLESEYKARPWKGNTGQVEVCLLDFLP